MEWTDIEDDVRSVLETEILPEESATESGLISTVKFLRYRELGICGTNERSVRQNVDIRECVLTWPLRLRHKLYNELQNKLNNDDDWPHVNSDAAEVLYKVMWMTWEINQNLYYHLYGIDSFEEYVYKKKWTI